MSATSGPASGSSAGSGLGPNASLIGVPGSRWRLQTPALVLDLDAFSANLQAMADWAKQAGLALRPHAKSHKSPEIARRQVEAGALGVCCATVREAEAMAAAGIPGILITTPVALGKLHRIAALAEHGADIACVADHVDYVEALQQACVRHQVRLRVLVDLDPGQGRTGVTRPLDAVAVARAIVNADNLDYRGVQAYAGFLQHIDELAAREERLAEPLDLIAGHLASLREANMVPAIITGGGTGSHRLDRAKSPFTEVQVGSYVFMDVQYNSVEIDEEVSSPYRTSLFVQTSVVNVNHGGYAVTDAGLKSFATDGPAPVPARGAPPGATYRYMGDEHGAVVFARKDDRLGLGARVECVTPHCDPNVNLYDVYHVVRGDDLVDIWPVAARGNP